jgi:hypothetical protein
MTTTARHITLNSAAALITIVVGLLTAGSMVGGYLVDNHRRDAITQHRHDATTQRLDRLEAEVKILRQEAHKP